MKKINSIVKRTWYFIIALGIYPFLIIVYSWTWLLTFGKTNSFNISDALHFKEQHQY